MRWPEADCTGARVASPQEIAEVRAWPGDFLDLPIDPCHPSNLSGTLALIGPASRAAPGRIGPSDVLTPGARIVVAADSHADGDPAPFIPAGGITLSAAGGRSRRLVEWLSATPAE